MRLDFNKIIYITLIATLSLTVGSCNKVTMEQANKAYEKKEFNKAASMYKEVARTSKNKNEKKEAYYQEALCYIYNNEYKNAEKTFAKAAKLKSTKSGAERDLTIMMYEAIAIKNQERYEEAIQKFNELLKEYPNNQDALREKEGCELALKWKDQKTRYVIENFKKVNTKENDFAPFYLDKDGLVFTSSRIGGVNKKNYTWTGEYYDDVYISKIKKKNKAINFETPVLLSGTVNTKFSDGVTSFDDKARVVYYTQCGGEDGKTVVCKIYSAKRVGKESFEQSVLLDFNSDSFSCGHPAITPDGKQLFFASNMPGGYGGWDIYVVNYIRRGNTWSVPLNLGPTINTAGDEMYPFVHSDGSLYFSSNGHVGLGGMDLYSTTGSGQDWTTPENMKSPINSGGDDFGIWLAEDKESGYFSSNRTGFGARGGDDIYSFTMKPCELAITGVVRDKLSKAVIPNATVYIKNNQDTSTIVLKTDASGAYKLPLKRNTKYELSSKGPEDDYYYDSPKEFQTTEGVECFTTLQQDFELEKLLVEFTLEGILYDLDRAFIRKDAARILDDSVVAVLKRFPRIRVELGSHTDCRASHRYNEALSQARADSAVEYIISRGIHPERLVAKGYGETDLRIKKCACELRDVNRVCTEAEHQLNRRTTIKVLDLNFKPTKSYEEAVKEWTKNMKGKVPLDLKSEESEGGGASEDSQKPIQLQVKPGEPNNDADSTGRNELVPITPLEGGNPTNPENGNAPKGDGDKPRQTVPRPERPARPTR